jgi:hypothetical protein
MQGRGSWTTEAAASDGALDILPPSATASLPPEDRACITAAANKLPPVTALGIKEAERCRKPSSRAPVYTASRWRSTSVWPDKVRLTSLIVSVMAR